MDQRVFIMAVEGCTNSTKVNRRKLMPKERHEVKVDDEIVFGKDGPYILTDLSGVVRPSPTQIAPRQERTEGPSRMERERTAKRGVDERISLTNPDAKNFLEQKLKERLNQDSVLNRHAENVREEEAKKNRLKELLTRQTLLQEKVAHLKSRSEELAAEIATLEDRKKKDEAEVLYGQESSSKVPCCKLDWLVPKRLGGFRC